MLKLKDFKSKKTNLKRATLAFLLKDSRILLAYKKRGFGEGKWNGVGGKLSSDESVDDAFLRETSEEIGVNPLKHKKTATLHFYDPHVESNNFVVDVFFVNDWSGDIKESDEVKPKWFEVGKIPYSDMWPDDVLWLPEVLSEKVIEAHFLFDQDTQIEEHEIIHIEDV